MHKFLVFAAATALFAATGCREEDMQRAAVELRRLGNAVEGELWRGETAEPEQLMAKACSRDPALCEMQNAYSVQVKVESGHAILLLCTKDGKQALLESVACTSTAERQAWKQGDAPCQFTLTVGDSCR